MRELRGLAQAAKERPPRQDGRFHTTPPRNRPKHWPVNMTLPEARAVLTALQRFNLEDAGWTDERIDALTGVQRKVASAVETLERRSGVAKGAGGSEPGGDR
jgi:hypothetical protein